ncbi:hypothetical protein GCM10022378_15670 [Salinicoccus jeotgali]|uniref:SigE-dependent sporulation protein n=1 Tax=Salinicoccus jeotgali TaxID=381634 RepID=A0ABP7EY42_9STAP
MMPFLYFPEDKSEYIPAFITLAICMLLAYLAYRLIKRYSEKQEQKMKEFEEQVMKRMEQESDEPRSRY